LSSPACAPCAVRELQELGDQCVVFNALVRHFGVEEADSRLEPVRTLLEGFTERMLCDHLPPTVGDLRSLNDQTFIEILRSAGTDGIRDALRHIYYGKRESFFLLGHATVTHKPPLTQPRSQVHRRSCRVSCFARQLRVSCRAVAVSSITSISFTLYAVRHALVHLECYLALVSHQSPKASTTALSLVLSPLEHCLEQCRTTSLSLPTPTCAPSCEHQ
jgi:hypothetical protein